MSDFANPLDWLPIWHKNSPFIEIKREAWGRIAANAPLPLTEADLERLRSLGRCGLPAFIGTFRDLH